MTRRQALLTAVPAYAQLRFPSFVYRDYPRCLPAYLSALALASREKRLRALAALKTPDAVRQRQQWVRNTLLHLIGELPDRTPLNARKTGVAERDGFSIEKIVYESRPNYYVSANLYVPSNAPGPLPGVLFQLGHSDNGKAYDPYQRACQGLAKLGFLVLAFDPMGQGERVYYPDSSAIHSRLGDVDEEHTKPGRQMLLVGATCTQFQLWDAIRSLDYLAGHPLVDPKRLASVGQSGGATLSMLLAAVDDRPAAIAEFSGNTENLTCKNFLPPGSTDDAEQNLIGAGPLGFDRWDLFYPFAPKPMFISISDKDSFGTYSPNYVSDSTEEFKRLAQTYQVLGAEKHLGSADTPLPHGLSYDSRLELYNFLRLHLKHEPEPVREEPPVSPLSAQELWVSESGNLVKSFGGETPFSLTKKLRGPLPEGSPNASLKQLLCLEPASPVPAKILRTVPSARRVSIAALDVPSAENVGLPAWLFRNEQPSKNKPPILILDSRGRNSLWHEGGLGPTLAAEGFVVCAADVRGIGDLAPQYSAGAPGYAHFHQESESYAWSSLMLGRPLAGQRVTDILTLVRALRQITGAPHIALAASHELTVPALLAASLDLSIGGLYLTGGLSSFASILEAENYRHPFANFVPGILKHTDLPEIAAALAPRRIVLAGPVGGDGVALTDEAAKQVYRSSIQSGHLTVSENSAWDAPALAAFVSGLNGA